MIHLGIIAFIDHHLLNQPDTPLQHCTALACTCKEAHALLAKRLQEHKWKTFQPEFLKQLDFVDMFIMSYNLNRNADTHTVYIPYPGPSCIVASVRRDWDFVKELVTVTVESVQKMTPVYQGTQNTKTIDRGMWKNGRWTFSYEYDKTRDRFGNYQSINTLMQHSLARHQQTYRAAAKRSLYFTFAAITAVLGVWLAYV